MAPIQPCGNLTGEEGAGYFAFFLFVARLLYICHGSLLFHLLSLVGYVL